MAKKKLKKPAASKIKSGKPKAASTRKAPGRKKLKATSSSKIEIRKITLGPSPLAALKVPLAALMMVIIAASLGYFVFKSGDSAKTGTKPRASIAFQKGVEKVPLVRIGKMISKGRLRTLRMAGDKLGNLFHLNYGKGAWQISKYSPQNKLLIESIIDSSKIDLARVKDFAADASGQTYILLRNGTVHIFTSSLAHSRTIQTNTKEAIAIDIDSRGRIYILSKKSREVSVFSSTGEAELSFGQSDDNKNSLRAPLLLAVTADGKTIVIENVKNTLTARVYTATGSLTKTFSINEFRSNQFLFLGIGPKDRLYFNNHMGNGIFFYSIRGKLLGSAAKTDKKDFLSHPGGLSVNKWTGDIHIDFSPGFIRCRLN